MPETFHSVLRTKESKSSKIRKETIGHRWERETTGNSGGTRPGHSLGRRFLGGGCWSSMFTSVPTSYSTPAPASSSLGLSSKSRSKSASGRVPAAGRSRSHSGLECRVVGRSGEGGALAVDAMDAVWGGSGCVSYPHPSCSDSSGAEVVGASCPGGPGTFWPLE
jgi:hypothetical protein